jgi:hypothetical protein
VAALTSKRGRCRWRGRILSAGRRSDGGSSRKSNGEGGFDRGVLQSEDGGVGREPRHVSVGQLPFERRWGEAGEGWGSRKSSDAWREKGHEQGGLVLTGEGQRGRRDVSAQWGGAESLMSGARLAAGMGRWRGARGTWADPGRNEVGQA